MLTTKKIRLVNPKAASPSQARKRRPNPPGALVSLGLLNPQRSPMQKKAKHRKTNKKAAPPKRHHKKPNPFVYRAKTKKHTTNKRSGHRRRRNPGIASAFGKPIELLTSGAFALAGVVATRQLPQIALKEKNTGVWGYFANLLTALATSAVVTKFAGRTHGFAAGIGGGAYLASRILSEQVSPIGKVLSLSGLGDAAAAGNLGAIVPDYFPRPVVRDGNGNPIIPRAITEASVAAMRASMPATSTAPVLKGLGGRRGWS